MGRTARFLLLTLALGCGPAVTAAGEGEETRRRARLFGWTQYEICSTCFRDAPGLAPGAGGPSWRAPRWLAGEPHAGTWIATGVLATGWAALALEGDSDLIQDVGEVTLGLSLATGLGMTLAARDWRGMTQYGISLGTSTALVQATKRISDKYRPDLTDSNSFPSGHTQAAFAGAGYVFQRYGPRWGIPSLVLASYTGYSRVEAEKHFIDDVISGGAIGLFSSLLFVEPVDPARAARWRDLERPRPYRVEWEMADGDVSRNNVRAPRATGTLIDFRFDGEANPQITASLAGDLELGKRHSLRLRYTPFEVREVATLEEDTHFGDRFFVAGTDIASIYFLGDFRARYSFEMVPESPFSARFGAGLTIIDTVLEMVPVTIEGEHVEIHERKRESVRALDFLPLVYVRLGVDLARRFELYAEWDAWRSASETFRDLSVKLLFRVNPKWDVAVGYRWVDDDLNVENVRNDFSRKGGLVHFAYSF